ncbi:MAG: hypothetical protein IPO78_07150 [Saprospiraceae bacterium]|nr:hypothetical protein [Saprospiraceae bacterium]MBK8484294.1 hypothetical protein [Saprospiraceae bacterium]MBK9221679.1 hypothetical protein [Saprospiraceae bacterium]MBK9721384.1 hypothetical protein [Saprospiraceae bacterium]MBK9728395.1 hypothetical protein [Saprospiraceae bacterium]
MNKIIIILFLAFVILFFNDALFAQCPMCKMAAETNLKSGGSAGKGLNTGILYLLAMPYLIVFTLIVLWRRNKKKLLQT